MENYFYVAVETDTIGAPIVGRGETLEKAIEELLLNLPKSGCLPLDVEVRQVWKTYQSAKCVGRLTAYPTTGGYKIT